MSALPPTFADRSFDDLSSLNKEQLNAVFTPVVEQLHLFLNGLPCLRDLQRFRGQRLGIRPRSSVAFRTWKVFSGEWYTYHYGGSTEMQFNVGMYGSPSNHLRVGMGFCFYGPSRPAVNRVFSRFATILDERRGDFCRFASEKQLEVERQTGSEIARREPRIEPVAWLFTQAQSHPQEWLSVGRLLRRREHGAILSDAARLAEVIEGVFSGFRPFYEELL